MLSSFNIAFVPGHFGLNITPRLKPVNPLSRADFLGKLVYNANDGEESMRNKMAIYLFLVTVMLAVPSLIFCQGQTDVYLIEIKMDNGKYVFHNPVKVSQRDGYNNQPFFHPDGNSLFYSSGSGSNTDVFRYDIDTGTTTQLTDTPDSEYSPAVMPGGEKISVIQLITVEGPRKGAQPFLAFPLAGGEPELIFEDGEKVGYSAWIDPQRVVLFLLGTPNILKLVDLGKKTSKKIAENIGRSLYKIPHEEAISFSQIQGGGLDTIMSYDLKTGATEPILAMLRGNGFYTWTSTGFLMMGLGPKLYIFKPDVDMEWQLIGDLSEFGIDNVTRIAVDSRGQRLAVVDGRQPS